MFGAKAPRCIDPSQGLLLPLDPTVIGVIHLGEVEMPQGDLDQHITEMGADNGTYDGGSSWSNLNFIIRILDSLSDANMIEIPSTIGQLGSIIEDAGSKLELMKSWGGDPLPVFQL